jgi:hypothetical protein
MDDDDNDDNEKTTTTATTTKNQPPDIDDDGNYLPALHLPIIQIGIGSHYLYINNHMTKLLPVLYQQLIQKHVNKELQGALPFRLLSSNAYYHGGTTSSSSLSSITIIIICMAHANEKQYTIQH